MASAFSTSDTAILTAPLELDPLLQAATASSSKTDLAELYDVERTVSTILAHGFRSVALQFPDEALVDSVPVYWALRDELGRRIRERRRDSSAAATAKTGEDALPELYILADTSYGNCCVDEVAAAHVDADLVVHYGHTCLSPTANLPALYVFPRLPIDTAHAATCLADFARTELSVSSTEPESTRRTLVLAYDVSYAHASDEVLAHLRASEAVREAGWEVYAMEIDTKRSFEDKVRGGRAARAPLQRGAGCACTTTDGAGCGTGCASQAGAGCCGQDGACGPSSSASRAAGETVSSTSDARDTLFKAGAGPAEANADEDEGTRMALSSGRFVRLPKDRTLDAASSAVLYLGPESRALTNLLLHLGPAFPVLSYDPTQASSSANAAPPVRRETGRTNRLLMQRYAMVQRARDASVVGLLVGTLGVASYLPLLDRLRARLSDARGKGKRKVYTVSVGKLNPAKLANFQEIEVWVLVACPENSLVGSKSGLGGGRGGPNGHNPDFWRPIVTPYEMELALGPEGVWTGEYEVDLGRLADKLEKTGVDDGEENVKEGDQDEDEDDEDRPHYSFVTGSYVSRTRYGADNENQDDSSRQQKPGTTVVALRGAGSNAVSVIQSASGLTHVQGGAHLGEREWTGLRRPEGVDRFVPSVLEVGRSGIAGGYSHAGGEAEGGGGGEGGA
ncbi:Diphthamide biosynthesis protein 2 [Tilletia horrida]|uniref:Diphthamide biosynthesis protein 2 n=1 Tax=Tilletia horrida TaxID=155126 RepID=A0AAN6GFI8_9BASI|nr:Diphthamide biosynthesis protein 2 [Tilletia horrida]